MHQEKWRKGAWVSASARRKRDDQLAPRIGGGGAGGRFVLKWGLEDGGDR